MSWNQEEQPLVNDKQPSQNELNSTNQTQSLNIEGNSSSSDNQSIKTQFKQYYGYNSLYVIISQGCLAITWLIALAILAYVIDRSCTADVKQWATTTLIIMGFIFGVATVSSLLSYSLGHCDYYISSGVIGILSFLLISSSYEYTLYSGYNTFQNYVATTGCVSLYYTNLVYLLVIGICVFGLVIVPYCLGIYAMVRLITLGHPKKD